MKLVIEVVIHVNCLKNLFKICDIQMESPIQSTLNPTQKIKFLYMYEEIMIKSRTFLRFSCLYINVYQIFNILEIRKY